jgi:hypothetical protein
MAAALGGSIVRISQIEHGEMTSYEVIARYVEALGGPAVARILELLRAGEIFCIRCWKA